MHALNQERWATIKNFKLLEKAEKARAEGKIKRLGFSFHDEYPVFEEIINAYDWDFCQIQYNYLDEHTQAGRRGLYHAHEKGLPVIIMEPLRGGRLVNNLPQGAIDAFAAHPAGHSPAQWALKWLWDQKEVTCILSGMNSMEMLEENLRVATEAQVGELTPEDRQLYADAVQIINESVRVGCTGCGYCQPCPKGVDIPGTFAALNRWYGEDKHGAFTDYLKCTTFRKNATGAGNCIGCGKCEAHCPQNIAIRQELEEAKKVLETPLYKLIRWGAKKFVKF
jgi:predicted aldo/keto reductase-like oxidoreductase